MDNDLTIKQAREAAAHPPGPRPPARAAGAVPRVILGDWLCWVLSGMWGGREWWDPPAAAGRVRGEGSAEMRPGARKAAGGDGYASRMNWGGWGALWGARGTIAGLFRGLRCRLRRIRSSTRRWKRAAFAPLDGNATLGSSGRTADCASSPRERTDGCAVVCADPSPDELTA